MLIRPGHFHDGTHMDTAFVGKGALADKWLVGPVTHVEGFVDETGEFGQVGEALGVDLQEPWRGLPMLNGGVDMVYDTVTSPETLEVGVRITRPRGSVVALGVEPPKRFEWTRRPSLPESRR